MSWPHLGAYGNSTVRTPNLDKMASEGLLFENAFVNTSSCTPSRASILTGRNGFELKEGATLWGYLPAEFKTYTEILAERGYRIGASGKGWGPGFLIDREVNPAGNPINSVKHDPYSKAFNSTATSDIDYAGNFESFLSSKTENQPFCFWIGTYEPHRGYTQGLASSIGLDTANLDVPAFLPDVPEVRNDINEYYAEIEHIDSQVGKVFEILNDNDLANNTIVIFTSDNGMPFPRAKATLYDYGTRIPLILWMKNTQAKTKKVSDLISTIDLAPTILNAANCDVPKEMSGFSLLPYFDSQATVKTVNRSDIITYRERHAFQPGLHGKSYPSRALRTKDHLLIWNLRPNEIPQDVDGSPTKHFMMTNRERYPQFYELSFGKRPEYELYVVNTDPFQINNLAYLDEYIEIRDSLLNRLKFRLMEKNDPRMISSVPDFVFNPYFGTLFERQLVKWTPEQQGQEIGFEERRKLMKQAFKMIDEEFYFEEVLEKQDGKL